MSHTLLRLATPDDAPAMLEIYTPYVLETPISFEIKPPSLPEFKNRLLALQPKFPWLVLENSSRIIGYAYACSFGEREAYNWAASLSVYVNKTHIGNGAGHILYNALLAILKKQGYLLAYGKVVTANPESMSFHRKMGFKEEATLRGVGFKLGQYLDVCHFRKELLPPVENPPQPLPFSSLPTATVAQILSNSL